jgi:hypothetical protein
MGYKKRMFLMDSGLLSKKICAKEKKERSGEWIYITRERQVRTNAA